MVWSYMKGKICLKHSNAIAIKVVKARGNNRFSALISVCRNDFTDRVIDAEDRKIESFKQHVSEEEYEQ